MVCVGWFVIPVENKVINAHTPWGIVLGFSYPCSLSLRKYVNHHKEEVPGKVEGEKGRNWMKIDKGPAGITNKTGSQETEQ